VKRKNETEKNGLTDLILSLPNVSLLHKRIYLPDGWICLVSSYTNYV